MDGFAVYPSPKRPSVLIARGASGIQAKSVRACAEPGNGPAFSARGLCGFVALSKPMDHQCLPDVSDPVLVAKMVPYLALDDAVMYSANNFMVERGSI